MVSSIGGFLQLLESGLTIGLVYGLVGLGYVTIYRTSGVVNFAQGEFVMLGGMMSYQIWKVWGWPYWLSMVATVVAVGIIGALIYLAVIAPLRRRRASILILVMATIGVSFLIQAVGTKLWTAYPIFGPNFSSTSTLTVGGVAIGTQDLWTIGTALVLVVGLFYVTNRTRVGKAMTATATDPLAAGMVGVRTGSMICLAFVISAVIGAIAGAVVSPIVPITTTTGSSLAIFGFVAAVLGGWGKPLGAVVGGVVLGIVETLAGGFIQAGYKSAVGLVVLLLVLYFKPSGLLGSSLIEAES